MRLPTIDLATALVSSLAVFCLFGCTDSDATQRGVKAAGGRLSVAYFRYDWSVNELRS